MSKRNKFFAVKFLVGLIMGTTAIIAFSPFAQAASGTSCLCKNGKGPSIVRHHRWACDYKMGYVDGNGLPTATANQTCNLEELVQYKVWACMEKGCTYEYSGSLDQRNSALGEIKHLSGSRNP